MPAPLGCPFPLLGGGVVLVPVPDPLELDVVVVVLGFGAECDVNTTAAPTTTRSAIITPIIAIIGNAPFTFVELLFFTGSLL